MKRAFHLFVCFLIILCSLTACVQEGAYHPYLTAPIPPTPFGPAPTAPPAPTALPESTPALTPKSTPAATVKPTPPPASSSAPTPAAAPAADAYLPGDYSAQAKGYGGPVTVRITVDAERILSIEAQGEAETIGVGSRAIDELPALLLAAQGSRVDGVSGATFTSQAVFSALQQARQKARATQTAFHMAPSTYSDTAPGYAGIIQATVTVTENAITDIQLVNMTNPDSLINEDHPLFNLLCVSCRENDQIFSGVATLLPARIIEAQSLAVDAITGATASSHGALLAIRRAISFAGAPDFAFCEAPQKSAAQEELACDIVVVGGGTAGCTAAAQAVELGASVILVEKSARLGGTGALSAGPMSLNSSQQLSAGYREDIDKFYEEYDLLMHWSIKGELFRKLLNTSGDTIDWLNEKGVRMQPDTSAFAETHGGPGRLMAYTHLPYTGLAVQEFFTSLTQDVPTILTETTATELMQAPSGAITGVKAMRYDGTTYTIRAKAVIMATGSFGGNDTLMQQQLGAAYKLLGLKQNDGSGLTMMLAAGAQEYNASTVCSHAIGVPRTPSGFAAFDRAIPHTLVTTAALLHINNKGERFMNEEIQDKDMTRGSVMHAAQGSTFYVLFSQDQVDDMRDYGTIAVGQAYDPTAFSFENVSLARDIPLQNIQAVLDAAVSQELALKADTLNALADALGADSAILTNTVQTYNAMCEAGSDTAFGKTVSTLNMLQSGPYYALKGTAVIYNAIGGVEVDANMQVMDINGKLMPGLYAAGADSMGNIMDGKAYTNVSGMNLQWAFGSGRMAAQAAYAALQ